MTKETRGRTSPVAITTSGDIYHRANSEAGRKIGCLENEFHFQFGGTHIMRCAFSCRARWLSLACLLGVAFAIPSAQQDTSDPASTSRPIQDNSFLIEEAYNQEAGVVQHINTFSRSWATKDWVYTFTQEWPLPKRPRHQFSYTVPMLNSTDARSGAGVGDIALNYRYQVLGNGDARLSFAPRVSLLLSTGSATLGRGSGGTGLQGNLPVSLVLNRYLVTHWNIGATIIPSAKNARGETAFSTGYNLGQSAIWLVRPNFNLMLETFWAGTESVVARGVTQRSHDLLLGPGVRWALNLPRGLQIVPGISLPIGVGPSADERNLFVYLSFEHPFQRER